MQLSHTAKEHPGYYTYALCKVLVCLFETEAEWCRMFVLIRFSRIDDHLQSTVPESVRKKILYLSKLLARSQRIGASSYIPGSRHGQYHAELEATIKQYTEKPSNTSCEPPTKPVWLCADQKWNVVGNMLPWIHTPLGLYPGQVMSADFLDLPGCLDEQRQCKCERVVL